MTLPEPGKLVDKDRTYLFIARTRTYPTFWPFFVRTYLPTPTRPFWSFIRIFFCVHLNNRDHSLRILRTKKKIKLLGENRKKLREIWEKMVENVGKNGWKIWEIMVRGRVGVGHSLSEPTDLKHCQNTYRHLPTGRSRSDPYMCGLHFWRKNENWL